MVHHPWPDWPFARYCAPLAQHLGLRGLWLAIATPEHWSTGILRRHEDLLEDWQIGLEDIGKMVVELESNHETNWKLGVEP
jgi:hypothetical protein